MKTMETRMDVIYFIKKFQPIEEALWHVGDFCDDFKEKFCALGFCGARRIDAMSASTTNESEALSNLFKMHLYLDVAQTNDGEIPAYNQATPKERILNALYDIYEKTYGRKYSEHPAPKAPEVVERVVYVSFDASVRELQKQLAEN